MFSFTKWLWDISSVFPEHGSAECLMLQLNILVSKLSFYEIYLVAITMINSALKDLVWIQTTWIAS